MLSFKVRSLSFVKIKFIDVPTNQIEHFDMKLTSWLSFQAIYHNQLSDDVHRLLIAYEATTSWSSAIMKNISRRNPLIMSKKLIVEWQKSVKFCGRVWVSMSLRRHLGISNVSLWLCYNCWLSFYWLNLSIELVGQSWVFSGFTTVAYVTISCS